MNRHSFLLSQGCSPALLLPRIPPAYGAGEPLCPFPGFVAGGRPSAIYMARGRFKRPSVGERAPNSLSTAPRKKRLRNNPKPLALFLFYQYSTFKPKNLPVFFRFFKFLRIRTGKLQNGEAPNPFAHKPEIFQSQILRTACPHFPSRALCRIYPAPSAHRL